MTLLFRLVSRYRTDRTGVGRPARRASRRSREASASRSERARSSEPSMACEATGVPAESAAIHDARPRLTTRLLRDHRAARPGRDGSRLPGDRFEAEARGRHQGPPQGVRRVCRPPCALRARGVSERRPLADLDRRRDHAALVPRRPRALPPRRRRASHSRRPRRRRAGHGRHRRARVPPKPLCPGIPSAGNTSTITYSPPTTASASSSARAGARASPR